MRVIYKEEEMYGFIDDIIEEFENAKANDEENADIYNDAIQAAKRIQEDENYGVGLFKVWYNPMGAFIFTRMVEEN